MLENPELGLIAIGVIMAIINLIPVPGFLVIIAIVNLAYLAFPALHLERSIQRKYWLDVYLKSNSPIYVFLKKRTQIINIFSLFASLLFGVIAYISICHFSLFECMLIVCSLWAAFQFDSLIASQIDSHASFNVASILRVRTFYFVAGVLVLFSLVAAGFFGNFSLDYSEKTADQLASEVIASCKHPCDYVRHYVRTLHYCELQLLRVRDIVGFPLGWIIYIFFLIPNILPAFAITAVYLGINIRIKQIQEQNGRL